MAEEPELGVNKLKAQAADIRIAFSEIRSLWGVPFDQSDLDHLLVAAWEIGHRKGAMAAYRESLDAILHEFAGGPRLDTFKPKVRTPKVSKPKNWWQRLWG